MKFFFAFFILLFLLFLQSCFIKSLNNRLLDRGIWRGTIGLQGQQLPFLFEVSGDSSRNQDLYLINGEEKIYAGRITWSGDSAVFPMHIFDTNIMARYRESVLSGYWKKNYLPDYFLPFRADYGKPYRFSESPRQPSYTITGKWDAVFSNASDTTRAIGVFEQYGNHLKGTFLLTSGDYRYLDGEVDGDSLRLSTFDGEHAYLFKAKILNHDSLRGMYWSGKTWNEPWVAVRNPNAKLPDTDSLAFLKPGYTKIDFRFPGLDGNPVTPEDPKYRNKVIILQVLGTWCPNCMDETRFLAGWYKRHRKQGVEIIGLAFERKDDFVYASARVKLMKQKLGADYDFVIAGKSGAGNAAQALPMLKGEIDFPTTIFIDRKGKVRKIHTGFSGPGTGIYYTRFIEDFDAFMNQLLAE